MVPSPGSPDETYGNAPMPRERCRRYVQIWDLGGDRRYRRPKDVRQFHTFHIDIVPHVRDPSCSGRSRSMPRTVRRSGSSAGWSPDNHFLGNLFDERCITDKLNSIAKTVVTAHQDPLARQGVPSQRYCRCRGQCQHGTPARARSIASLIVQAASNAPRRIQDTQQSARGPRSWWSRA